MDQAENKKRIIELQINEVIRYSHTLKIETDLDEDTISDKADDILRKNRRMYFSEAVLDFQEQFKVMEIGIDEDGDVTDLECFDIHENSIEVDDPSIEDDTEESESSLNDVYEDVDFD